MLAFREVLQTGSLLAALVLMWATTGAPVNGQPLTRHDVQRAMHAGPPATASSVTASSVTASSVTGSSAARGSRIWSADAVGAGKEVEDGWARLESAKQSHLWRVGAWGAVNVAGGLALVLAANRSTRPARWNFGAMSAGWGAVNMGIAAAGLAALGGSPPSDAEALLAAERQFHDILLLNLGLNVAYSGVGATMLTAGYRGVDAGGRWRGFGTSLIFQGVGLLVLDGVAFIASRARLSGLIGVAGDLSARALPAGVALSLSL